MNYRSEKNDNPYLGLFLNANNAAFARPKVTAKRKAAINKTAGDCLPRAVKGSDNEELIQGFIADCLVSDVAVSVKRFETRWVKENTNGGGRALLEMERNKLEAFKFQLEQEIVALYVNGVRARLNELLNEEG